MSIYVIYAMYVLQEGKTPLIWASQEGHLECIKYLKRAGANVSEADEVLYIQQYVKKYILSVYVIYAMYVLQDGKTPLIWASSKGHLECIQYLISARANVSERNKVLYVQQYMQ